MRRQAHLWPIPLLASALAHAFSSRTRRDLADLVLRAASERSSVTHARSRCRRGTSDRHARRLLAALDLGLTQRALTRALRELASPYVPKRPVDVAIDFHEIPHYGEAIGPKHPQFVKTQEARGTHRWLRFVDLLVLLLRAVGYRLGSFGALENRLSFPEALRRPGIPGFIDV